MQNTLQNRASFKKKKSLESRRKKQVAPEAAGVTKVMFLQSSVLLHQCLLSLTCSNPARQGSLHLAADTLTSWPNNMKAKSYLPCLLGNRGTG